MKKIANKDETRNIHKNCFFNDIKSAELENFNYWKWFLTLTKHFATFDLKIHSLNITGW